MNKTYQILILLLVATSSFGQSYLFHARPLSTEDGLLGRRVNTIIQDDEGFIWIGTNEGINRFDGYTFRHFTKENFGLNSNRISSIRMDDVGDIWISYIQDQYSAVETQILKAKNHQLITLKEKLGDNYKEEYSTLKLVRGVFNDIMLFVNKNQVYQYTPSKEIVLFPLENLIYQEKTDKYWCLKDGRFFKSNLKQKEVDEIKIPNHKVVQATFIDKKNCFIIAKNATNSNVLIEKKIGQSDFKIIKEGFRNGGVYVEIVWIDGKLYWKDGNQLLVYDNSKNFKERPRAILKDRNNQLWIGSDNGFYILSYQKNVFDIYLKNAVSDEEPYDARGIWANDDYLYSFSPKTAFRWNFKTKQQETLSFFNKNGKGRRAISNVNNQKAWVGGHDGFPFEQIDIGTGSVLQSMLFPVQAQVWAVCEDRKTNVWIGTRESGLWKYDNTEKNLIQYKQFNGFDDIEKGKIIHIVADKTNPNLLWMSGESGWYLVDIDKGVQARFWSNATTDFKIPSNDIYYTYQDDKGVFWLGTAFSGLLRVELSANRQIKSVEQFTTKNGLSSNTIYGIFEDNAGFLWLSSNNGIIKFNKATNAVQAYLLEDGLSHYEFNRSSYFQRKDGEIFFGTLNGIVSFNPNELENKTAYDVPLRMAKCEKYSGKAHNIVDITNKVHKEKVIVLHPNDRFAALEVTLQDYFNAPKLQYAYKVNGLHKDFIHIKGNRIILTGLPYGRYGLTVKGRSKDGRFSTEELKLKLVVMQPLYTRWWFILLTALSVAVLVWQLFVARTKALKNRKKELEEIVKDRTAKLQRQAEQLQLDNETIEAQANELRSLDEMKSRFFANISHELRTPLTLILSPIQSIIKHNEINNRDFTYAQIIQQNAKKLLKRINEILDLTKLEANEMVLKREPTLFYDFVKRLVATFESLAQEREQSLIFKYQLDKTLQISLDKDKYEHIFNNYLSNAIKYTPNGGKITVKIEEQQLLNTAGILENQIVLSVNDNGQGILKEDLSQVFDRFFQTKNTANKAGSSGIGLALSKEIAQLMEGEVRAESVIGEGSTFFFGMPYEEELGLIENRELLNPNEIPTFSGTIDNEEELLNGKVNVQNTSEEGKPTILLVEDNPQLRQYIQLILSEKYNVITAENGQIALEKLSKPSSEASVHRQPSVVISDIMMPVMDGFELLKRLKHRMNGVLSL